MRHYVSASSVDAVRLTGSIARTRYAELLSWRSSKMLNSNTRHAVKFTEKEISEGVALESVRKIRPINTHDFLKNPVTFSRTVSTK